MNINFEQSVLPALTLEAVAREFRAAGFIFNEWHDDSFLNSPAGQRLLREHLFERVGRNDRFILPWVERAIDLRGKRIVEIGCGSGSASVSFARRAEEIHSYEIEGFGERSLKAAAGRARAMNIGNAKFYLEPAGDICRNVCARHGADRINIILLFAVIEHMTIEERIEALRSYFDLLADDGMLVIGGLPNRLSHIDQHTTGIPYFDTLPDALAIQYIRKSHRKYARDAMVATDPIKQMYRLGRGASYHEFEIAWPEVSLAQRIVLDGFEPEIVEFRAGYIQPEERLRVEFFEKHLPNVHRAFAKNWIEMVISKAPAKRQLGAAVNTVFHSASGLGPETSRSGVGTK